jgi:hypothetical protein
MEKNHRQERYNDASFIFHNEAMRMCRQTMPSDNETLTADIDTMAIDNQTLTNDIDAMPIDSQTLTRDTRVKRTDKETMTGDTTAMRCDVETITEYGCAKCFDNSAMRFDGKEMRNFTEKQRMSEKEMSEALI